MTVPEDRILTTPVDASVLLPTRFQLACEKSAVVTLGQAFVLLNRLRKQHVAGDVQEISAEEMMATALSLCRVLSERLEDNSKLVEFVPGANPTELGGFLDDALEVPDTDDRAADRTNGGVD